ncbi:MAG: molybdate ABC transporter substrate-binding protein [Atopobiaceae bacterium]
MTDTMTRRAFACGSAAVAAAVLSACSSNGSTSASGGSSSASDEKQKLIVFAAASLTESLTKAGDSFGSQQNCEMSYNFDSSGTLKTQIQNGAEADVFISAGQKQMNQLDAEATSGNDEGLDFIDHSTRFDILENKVTLVVPEGNPKSITSFDDLAERLKAHDVLLAMGNSDVPVGQYTQKILAYYNLDENELANAGCITYGTNVKEVTTQVSEGAVDCGIIYKTDATSAGLTVVDEATKDMCGQVVYPAAALKEAPNADGAAAFLEFLKGSEASADFEEVGFTPLS